MTAPSFTPPSAPFIYVECDIPDGLTLTEFRRSGRAHPARRSLPSRLWARRRRS